MYFTVSDILHRALEKRESWITKTSPTEASDMITFVVDCDVMIVCL
jgi:hypothetical protein